MRLLILYRLHLGKLLQLVPPRILAAEDLASDHAAEGGRAGERQLLVESRRLVRREQELLAALVHRQRHLGRPELQMHVARPQEIIGRLRVEADCLLEQSESPLAVA